MPVVTYVDDTLTSTNNLNAYEAFIAKLNEKNVSKAHRLLNTSPPRNQVMGVMKASSEMMSTMNELLKVVEFPNPVPQT